MGQMKNIGIHMRENVYPELKIKVDKAIENNEEAIEMDGKQMPVAYAQGILQVIELSFKNKENNDK
jgi:hypothetical protein